MKYDLTACIHNQEPCHQPIRYCVGVTNSTFGVRGTITREDVRFTHMEDVMEDYTQPHFVNNLITSFR